MTTLRLFPIRLTTPRDAVLTPRGGAMLAAMRHNAAALLSRYHPERHYMRGPGPACMAKLRTSPGPDAVSRD